MTEGDKLPTSQANAVNERIASKHDLDASLPAFEGACFRGDPVLLQRATDAAHAALQAHLDAIGSSVAITKRSHGL